MSPQRTASGPWSRFATRLNSLAEAPEPLGAALGAHLSAGEVVRVLVYGPPWVSLKTRAPATLLAVTDQRWLTVFDRPEGAATVAQSSFDDTLWIEFTDILLYGALRIAFVTVGGAQSVTIEFNTVMQRYYDEAVQLVLDGVDGIEAEASVAQAEWEPLLEPLPLKFRNAFLRFTPRGERLLTLVQWPAVFGTRRRWFQHELAPEAALALTDRELLLISEEKTWSWLRIDRPDKYGNIVTHCPLSRLEGYHVGERSPLVILDLTLRAGGTVGQTVQVPLPSDQKAAVLELVLRAFAQKPKAPVAAGEETYGQSALH